MKQTEIGMIPDDWEVRKFKSLTTRITVGIANSATHAYSDKGIIMFRNQNIKANYLDSYDLIYIKEEFANKYSNKQIKENDLLIARTGYPGTTCVVPKKYSGAQTFTTLIASPKCGLDSNYCAYFFNSNIGKRLFAAAQIGGAQKNVNANTLSNICISLPPTLSEQQKIAKALSDVDNVISTLEKLITKKKNLKQGTMQQLLTGKKRLPGFGPAVVEPVGTTKFKQTEIGEIPEDWEVKELGEVAKNFTGLTFSPDDVCDYGTLVLRSSNIQNDMLSFNDNVYVNMNIPERAIAHKGDILICVRNGSKRLIGKSALITDSADKCAFGAFMTVLRTELLNQQFLFYVWQSDLIQKQIEESMGATINQITNKDIRHYLIAYPKSNTEQTAIANVLSSMDKEIEALNTKLEKYRNLKTGMMQQLLTGKIRLV